MTKASDIVKPSNLFDEAIAEGLAWKHRAQAAEDALADFRKQFWAANLKLNVRKREHFSLLVADAAAGTVLHNASKV